MLTIALLAMIGYQLADAPQASPAEVARSTRESVLEELQTVALENCDLKRFGNAGDGGYLLCDDLSDGIESAYSFGHNAPFACNVAQRYRVPVHLDQCVDAGQPKCENGTLVLHEECIGTQSDFVEEKVVDSLEGQIYANQDAGKRLVVELDVEGDEWAPLATMPDDVLAQIDQMALEFHGVDDPAHLEILRRLKDHFFLVNVHFNNHVCSEATKPLPSPVFQVLLVNKNLGVVDPDAPVPAPPSPLNAPDRGGPDCQLEPEAPAETATGTE